MNGLIGRLIERSSDKQSASSFLNLRQQSQFENQDIQAAPAGLDIIDEQSSITAPEEQKPANAIHITDVNEISVQQQVNNDLQVTPTLPENTYNFENKISSNNTLTGKEPLPFEGGNLSQTLFSSRKNDSNISFGEIESVKPTVSEQQNIDLKKEIVHTVHHIDETEIFPETYVDDSNTKTDDYSHTELRQSQNADVTSDNIFEESVAMSSLGEQQVTPQVTVKIGRIDVRQTPVIPSTPKVVRTVPPIRNSSLTNYLGWKRR